MENIVEEFLQIDIDNDDIESFLKKIAEDD